MLSPTGAENVFLPIFVGITDFVLRPLMYVTKKLGGSVPLPTVNEIDAFCLNGVAENVVILSGGKVTSGKAMLVAGQLTLKGARRVVVSFGDRTWPRGFPRIVLFAA